MPRSPTRRPAQAIPGVAVVLALLAFALPRAGAGATLDKAGVDPSLRTWLEKAAGQLEVA